MNTINWIAYYFNVAVTYITYVVTYLYDYFREFPFIIKVATISLIISGLLIILSFLRLIWNALKRVKQRKMMKRINKRFSEGVRAVMSPESNNNMTRDDVIEAFNFHEYENSEHRNYPALLKNDKERMALCRLIYEIRISDDSAIARKKNLKTLLDLFELSEFLERTVNRAPMELKVEAMHMFLAFKLPISPWIANQMMNTKRIRAKRLAMYTSIMANTITNMNYFETKYFDDNCCIYDEIQIGYALQRMKSIKRRIPNIAHWAKLQKNPISQCIFIRLMRQFNQREYCADLEELYQYDSDKKVIEEISRTWGYLHYEEGEEMMRDLMMTQNDDTKVAIMHALTRIASGKSLEALITGYRHSGSQHVKYEALRCIYSYSEEGKAKFAELEASATPAESRLFEFFHNKYTFKEIELADTDTYDQLYGNNIFSIG